MFRHGHARRAVLLLMVLAAAFLWAADPGLRAAASDRAETGATPAKTADKAVTGTTAKEPPPATTAKAADAAATAADKVVAETTVTEPAPATAAAKTVAEPKAAAAQGKGPVTRDAVLKQAKKMTVTDQLAAQKRARALGMKPGVAGLKAGSGGVTALGAAPLPGTEGPGGIPHYFGPYGNWAFSPLPRGPITEVTLIESGVGYKNPRVYVDDAYGTSTDSANVTATTDAAGAITGLTIVAGGADYSAPVVTIIDDPFLCGGAAPPCGTGATADAVIGAATRGGLLTSGLLKFVDSLPGLGPAGANNLGQYIPVGVADTESYPQVSAPGAPEYKPASDYYEIALVEYEEKMHSDLLPTRLRGYVQLETPGLLSRISLLNGDGDPNNDVPESKSVDLGNGFTGYDNPHYLGPVIVAKGRAHGVAGAAGEPRPTRIKFYNLLPTGAGGDLFLPVDESVEGAGPLPGGVGKFAQNRATIHLHGNNTVWISDGNTHQWITPAGDPLASGYPAGVSARSVPDMPGCDTGGRSGAEVKPGDSGCMTFFYTNAQSARLQFYHDHAHGITRLNVYAGEAAGYVITDAVEQDMINGTNVSGVNNVAATNTPLDPGQTNAKVLPGLGIPLVIQDRTWVDAETIYAQDPTWNWGTAGPGAAKTGDLWYPHVYMTVQNPADPTGTNAVGRWHYGSWFNPPVPACADFEGPGCIEFGPVPNEYYDPINAPWEPPTRPGVPNPSLPGESFLDTPIVNGTAYPYLEVEPKAYRFRVLNASNDRFLNLQLYVAADKKAPTTAGTTGAVPCNGTVPVADCTEVAMVPVDVAPANQLADTPSGIPNPDAAWKGPDWWLIGTEGGFMPKPVVVPPTPIGFNLDMAYFAFGIVNQHSLFLGSAERADVVVDFSKFGNKTLILYNDSPAPVPAGAAPYDFFTGNGNQMDGGGAPNTQPGYGPNTRTIMQIRVTKTLTVPTPDVTLANLETVFAKTATKRGVFEVSQDPIIIPQAEYNSAYNSTFPSDVASQFFQIADTGKTFQPIDENGVLQPAVTLPLEMKAMHDEMGGVYDTMYGRMSGMLGLSLQNSPIHVLVPYGYSSPPVDIVKGSVDLQPVGSLADGTQLWRIFHNGVDTHTIHTHLFHAQLVNRVDQSGQLVGTPVDPIELGWKDTIRVNPLEVTYFALRPTVPTPDQLPFEAPDSVRLINPALPEGVALPPPAPAGWFDPAGNPVAPVNHLVNFGWEYVWHCHILSHEEMDMMHALAFAVPPRAPARLTAGPTGPINNPRVMLTWTDNSVKEAQFTVERATNASFTTGVTKFNTVNPIATAPSQVTFEDKTVSKNGSYWYRVWAIGTTVGDVATPGFPTMSADSFSNTATINLGVPPAPASPTGLTATLQPGPQVSLTWTDLATNETGFVVERCPALPAVPPATGFVCSAAFAQIAAPGPRTGSGAVTYVDTTVAAGSSYSYRVKAVTGTVSSALYTNTASVVVPGVPAAPTAFTVAISASLPNTVELSWGHGGVDVATFTIQRATDARFTKSLNLTTVAANLNGGVQTAAQTVNPKTTYYYRIKANNSTGGSSAWTNASPFPIRMP